MILIIILNCIIILLLLLKNTLNTKENFTNHNNFEYSDNLSIEDIKQLKAGQIKMGNMLKVLDRICQKYKIRYFLIGGSLIGALAYNGWIPWDGDVDLEVHENDYNRLKDALKKELPKNMWFQSNETDHYYPKNCYSNHY